MMINDENENLNLSPVAAGRVNWSEIRKHAIGFRTLRSEPAESLSTGAQASREMVERVFAAAKAEFAVSVASMKWLTRLLLLCLGVAVVVVAVGILVASAYRYIVGGATLSVAAAASLIPIIHELLKIGRDQVKLETFLVRYGIALQLANTPEAYGKILDRFLDETSLMESTSVRTRKRTKRLQR